MKLSRIKKIILAIFIYVIFMIADIIYGIVQYNHFRDTYGDKIFSKGVVGLIICDGANFVVAIILTVAFVICIRKLDNRCSQTGNSKEL